MLLILLVPVIFTGSGCSPQPGLNEEQFRMALVREIKDYERKLGFQETENFLTYAPETESYDYYFYTEDTVLPYSLDDPRLRSGKGTRADVPFDLETHDVFFYAIDALAGIRTPVTRSLMEAPLSRFIQVIFHEDWHEQIEMPLGIEEPSAEVVSYGAAIRFAAGRFGEDADVFRELERNFENRRAESYVYAGYYERLETLYGEYHDGLLTGEETLQQKEALFHALGRDLRAIWGARPATLNNAHLAFQMTYLRHLPVIHQIYAEHDADLARIVTVLREMPQQGTSFSTLAEVKLAEEQALDYLRKEAPPMPVR